MFLLRTTPSKDREPSASGPFFVRRERYRAISPAAKAIAAIQSAMMIAAARLEIGCSARRAASSRYSARRGAGTSFNTAHTPRGTISKSSRSPSTGTKSGMRSIGLNAYAATAPASSFATSGVRGSRAAIQSVSASRLSSLARSLSRKRGFHEVRAPLADHDARRVGVARYESRHDRCVGDPQPVDAARLECGVDHARIVRAHPAGSHRVIDGVGPAADEIVERVVVVDVDRIAVARSVF